MPWHSPKFRVHYHPTLAGPVLVHGLLLLVQQTGSRRFVAYDYQGLRGQSFFLIDEGVQHFLDSLLRQDFLVDMSESRCE